MAQNRHDKGGANQPVIQNRKARYSYTITDSPLPLANYVATIKVTGEGEGCKVEWSSEFEPVGGESEAVDIVQDIYKTGLDNLKKMFGG